MSFTDGRYSLAADRRRSATLCPDISECVIPCQDGDSVSVPLNRYPSPDVFQASALSDLYAPNKTSIKVLTSRPTPPVCAAPLARSVSENRCPVSHNPAFGKAVPTHQ